jgi:type I restriction enzyme S subunit
MNWPGYPAYTKEGVPWLDQYPASWTARPLKVLVTMQNGESITSEAIDESGEYPVYGGNGLRGYTDAYTHQGDRVLIGRQGALCGNVHLVSGRYWASEHAIVTTPNRAVDPAWLAYALAVMNLGQYSQAAAQPGIAADVIGKLKVPTPPSSAEQDCIARFLDRETSKLDGLIAKQEQLIATLLDERTATITQLVTKGVDPDVEMKDSEVGWLGKIPRHWTVVKGTLIGRPFGSEPVGEDDVSNVGEIPFLKVSSLDADGLHLPPPTWFVSTKFKHEDDFLVFPKRGAAIFGNKVNIVRGAGVLDPNLMGWKLAKDNLLEFFGHLLKLIRLEEIADVSTVPQINGKHVAALRLPRPPLTEQHKIVRRIDGHCVQVNCLISQVQKMIETLREYRSALITDAVTGKIDVRGAA